MSTLYKSLKRFYIRLLRGILQIIYNCTPQDMNDEGIDESSTELSDYEKLFFLTSVGVQLRIDDRMRVSILMKKFTDYYFPIIDRLSDGGRNRITFIVCQKENKRMAELICSILSYYKKCKIDVLMEYDSSLAGGMEYVKNGTAYRVWENLLI